MPMDESIETLLFLQQAVESNYTTKATRVGHRVNNRYDQEMQLLGRIATYHACNLEEKQYKVSLQVYYNVKSSELSSTLQTFESKDSPQNYTVSYAGSVSFWISLTCWFILWLPLVDIDMNTCSCVLTRLIFCHVALSFFLHRKLSQSLAIPYDAVPPR